MTSPLKRARLAHGLTLEQVATAVGIDTGNLSRIERGAQVPSVARTARLAKFFAGAVTETQIINPPADTATA